MNERHWDTQLFNWISGSFIFSGIICTRCLLCFTYVIFRRWTNIPAPVFSYKFPEKADGNSDPLACGFAYFFVVTQSMYVYGKKHSKVAQSVNRFHYLHLEIESTIVNAGYYAWRQHAKGDANSTRNNRQKCCLAVCRINKCSYNIFSSFFHLNWNLSVSFDDGDGRGHLFGVTFFGISISPIFFFPNRI